MDIAENDQTRASRGLLTAATVGQLVAECVGHVAVLCIVGSCRTGKSWATTDWIVSRNDDLEHAAYVDCLRIGSGDDGVLQFNGGESVIRKDHYPKLALDGADIVVVDEPCTNASFVRSLVSRTAPDAGTAAHRLIVLLLQDTRNIEQFGLKPKQYRCYTTEGKEKYVISKRER